MTTSFKSPVGVLGSGRYAPYTQHPDKRFVHHAWGHKPCERSPRQGFMQFVSTG